MARPKHIRERNRSAESRRRAKLFYACNKAEKINKSAARTGTPFVAVGRHVSSPVLKLARRDAFCADRASDTNPFMRNPKSHKIHTKTSDACHTANFEHKGSSFGKTGTCENGLLRVLDGVCAHIPDRGNAGCFGCEKSLFN